MKNDTRDSSAGAWPKISVVTPSFNQAHYLEECIDSVLGQGYPNLEYFILDGGSTDGSAEIIRKYEKHLAYWRSSRDEGQFAAINDGLRRCTGEIMTWINSDDRLVPGSLEIAAIVFSQRPEVAWLTGRPNGFDANGKSPWMADQIPSWSREQFLRKEYTKPYLQQEGTFWRRALWDKAGCSLRLDLHYAGDLELWMRFFRHAPLHVADALLGSFRSHANQKTAALENYHSEAEKVIDEENRAQQGVVNLAPPPPISADFIYGELAKRHPEMRGLLRLHERTAADLVKAQQTIRFLKKHWWTKLGRNLGLLSR